MPAKSPTTKEFVVVSIADATESVRQAEHFLRGVKALIG